MCLELFWAKNGILYLYPNPPAMPQYSWSFLNKKKKKLIQTLFSHQIQVNCHIHSLEWMLISHIGNVNLSVQIRGLEAVDGTQTPDTEHAQETDNMQYVPVWRHVMQNTLKEQGDKQLTGFIIWADEKHHPRLSHTQTHRSGVWLYDRLSMCSRELRQEDSSELKRWERLKWEIRHRGRGDVKKKVSCGNVCRKDLIVTNINTGVLKHVCSAL